MQRKQILISAIIVGGLAITLSIATGKSWAENPVKVGLRKQLLVDDYVIAGKSNVTRELGKVKKENKGQPVMRPNKNEYGLYFGVYSTVLHDEGKFKMWYLATNKPEYDIGYAESKDGICWERKDQEVGIDVSQDGWDSQMVEYAFVIKHTFILI